MDEQEQRTEKKLLEQKNGGLNDIILQMWAMRLAMPDTYTIKQQTKMGAFLLKRKSRRKRRQRRQPKPRDQRPCQEKRERQQQRCLQRRRSG